MAGLVAAGDDLAVRTVGGHIDDLRIVRPIRRGVLTEVEADLAARQFKAIADPVRLRLLNLLATSPEGEIAACDLVAPVQRSQPTVSHHLKVLREAGLVDADRRGQWIYYRVVPEQMEALRESLAVD